MQEIANRFKTQFGLFNAVGIVDGTPVVFSQRPAIDGEVYFTRKSQYAMNLQLVCDDRKRIRFYMIGWPGSMFDSTVFDKSKLIKNPNKYFTDGQYLLADCGYALKEHVMTPYKQPAASEPPNRVFNELFSSARCLIEHTNGMVKNRWASLKGVRTQIRTKKDFVDVNKHVLACLVLHNILLSFNDEWETEMVVEQEDEIGDMLSRLSIADTAIGKRVTIQNYLLRWKLGGGVV
jgi:hypothetical protein